MLRSVLGPRLWDLFCIASLVGIWPRYFEHRMLQVNRISVDLNNLHNDLKGLKIVHFSDLHLHPGVSEKYLNKVQKTINDLKPDIILFTGDLLCHSLLQEPGRLSSFLCSLKSKNGCIGIYGNHDYAEYVTQNLKGECDIRTKKDLSVVRAFKRFFWQKQTAACITARARRVKMHASLLKLLSATPFQFLENETIQLNVGSGSINICGLGDYWLGRCLPDKAFVNYNQAFPGIVLSHNPDTVPRLLPFPGDVILCGHTHGAQVNLPGIWKKFTRMENPEYKRGRLQIGSKTIYINRGIGSTEPFRWFSPPEITLLTLQSDL